MKTRLVIADDEYYIRQKIMKLIHTEELEIEITADFENGAQVVDYFATHSPDILLLDIRMPKLSGLEVSAYIAAHHPRTKVIILSGFNDFEYVRTTLRDGVFDYLLKPVDETVLNETLKNCLQALQEARRHEMLENRYEKELLLASIQRGHASFAALTEKYEAFRYYDCSRFLCFYVASTCEDEARQLSTRLRNAGAECTYFVESYNIFYIQVFMSASDDNEQLDEITRQYFDALTVANFYYLGECFAVSAPWSDYLKTGLEKLDYRFLAPCGDLTDFAPSQSGIGTIEISKIRDHLIPILNNASTDRFTAYIDTLFRQIEATASIAYLHLIVSDILAVFAVKYAAVRNYKPLPKDYVQTMIMEEHSLAEIEKRLVNYGLTYLKSDRLLPSDVRLSTNIIQYLMDHYREPSLSVSRLAAHFNLTSSYLGSVFKKVNNSSILQFLTTLRLTEANHLLTTKQYRVAEVAELVGFTDVFYFSKRFKKHFGLSPKDVLDH